MFIYSVVSVNRNIVRYNKYLVVVTLVVVLSVIVIVIVISLEHSTVVVGVFKFKFEYPTYSIFGKKSLIVYSVCSTINTEASIYYAAGFNGSGR